MVPTLKDGDPKLLFVQEWYNPLFSSSETVSVGRTISEMPVCRFKVAFALWFRKPGHFVYAECLERGKTLLTRQILVTPIKRVIE